VRKATLKKEVKTRKIVYCVFTTDDDGFMREPMRSGYYGREHIFNRYGYDTPEQAYDAIEKETSYGGYFVVPKMTIDTEYVWE